MKETKTIALFGATGSTGKEFLNLALEYNYVVKALVRTPEKIKITNPNLKVIKGDFSQEQAIFEVIENSDYIVCMAGSLNAPQKDLMYNFIQVLHRQMMKANVNNLVYQAGSFSYIPNQRKPLPVVLLRLFLDRIAKFNIVFSDHDNVMKYIDEEMLADGIDVIVTLPTQIVAGPSERDLEVHESFNFKSLKYIDLARFTLNNMGNKNLFGRFIYLK